MQADYDPDSGFHDGTIPEQEAKAHLGVFKHTDDVPVRYRLSNFTELDAEETWLAYIDSIDREISMASLEDKYFTPWEDWCEFARDERGINPITPADRDLEAWFEVAIEESKTIQTAHDTHFRRLHRLFEWLTEHANYPHRYNPVLQAILLNGATEALWRERLSRWKKYDHLDLTEEPA